MKNTASPEEDGAGRTGGHVKIRWLIRLLSLLKQSKPGDDVEMLATTFFIIFV